MLKDEFLQDFVDEAKAHIEKIEEAFLNTESFTKDPELINNVFRAVHSIKGSAGFFHLENIVSLSHAMENVLGQIRANHLVFSDDVLDALLTCNDLLKHMIYNISESADENISSALYQLENLLVGSTPIPTAQKRQGRSKKDEKQNLKGKTPAKSKNSSALTEKETVDVEKALNSKPLQISGDIDEKHFIKLIDLIKHGHKVYKIGFYYDKHLSTYYKNIEALFDNIKSLGQLISLSTNIDSSHDFATIIPLLESTPSKEVTVEILATSVLSYELFCEAISIPQNSVLWIKSDSILTKKTLNASPTGNAVPQMAQEDETVRVNVRLLENLMALSGEMVLARNQLLTTYNSKIYEPSTMNKILQNIDSLTSKLQEQVIQTRMQPIGNIFNKFPRLIRDIAKGIHKEIALSISGSEMELDKTMIESLADPLIHLVRNAADHGLESPDQREKMGKPRKGNIMLKAYHKGGLIAVEISDDGAGVDVPSVKAKAVEKGLIRVDEAKTLHDYEAFQLLFLPGFSTASIVSDISGRGVGMDVVRKNIEKLGGTVAISSQKGIGTTITIMLPRTLAIIQSLIVGAGGQRFAIPQANIARVINLKDNAMNSKFENIHRSKEYRLAGKLLPLIDLSDILEMKESERTSSKMVVLKFLNTQMGLLVDQVFDTQETLVKPLPSLLKPCISYSGVTIMGDGMVTLILDPEGIAKKSGLNFYDSDTTAISNKSSDDIMLEYQNMMIFQCSGPELYAIDMNMVARVESIALADIETVGNCQYATIKGHPLRIIRPETYLPVCKEDYSSEKLTLIIPNLVRHPIGILIGKIVDNIKSHFTLDTEQLVARGIFGTITYKKHIVLILNVYELFELADPINYPIADPEMILKRQVLLVEDTPFFQHVEAKYLEGVGCEVTVAENGQVALEILKNKTFDIIISDLIMPVMDGLEFIRHVRSDTKLHDIPAIALTSMKSSNYINKALDNGFNAFENKLNKESLILTMDEVLKRGKRGVKI